MPRLERVRTTVAFERGLYEEARDTYERLGFRKMGDLVNEAVREYVARQRTNLKDRQMAAAAHDEAYLAALREVSDDFAFVDAENLPEY